MADVEHGDAWQEESVCDRNEGVVQVRVPEVAESDDRDMRDACDRAPQGGLAGGRYFVGVDGFFWPFSSYS
jgi:hypothetical protein